MQRRAEGGGEKWHFPPFHFPSDGVLCCKQFLLKSAASENFRKLESVKTCSAAKWVGSIQTKMPPRSTFWLSEKNLAIIQRDHSRQRWREQVILCTLSLKLPLWKEKGCGGRICHLYKNWFLLASAYALVSVEDSRESQWGIISLLSIYIWVYFN